MAKEDLELLSIKKLQYKVKINKLDQIMDICDQEFHIDDFDLYQLSSKARLIKDVLVQEIYELEKYVHCEHTSITEDILTGNDSHYDFYSDKCNDCGKKIREYKI
jgi:hypothetical protein